MRLAIGRALSAQCVADHTIDDDFDRRCPADIFQDPPQQLFPFKSLVQHLTAGSSRSNRGLCAVGHRCDRCFADR